MNSIQDSIRELRKISRSYPCTLDECYRVGQSINTACECLVAWERLYHDLNSEITTLQALPDTQQVTCILRGMETQMIELFTRLDTNIAKGVDRHE